MTITRRRPCRGDLLLRSLAARFLIASAVVAGPAGTSWAGEVTAATTNVSNLTQCELYPLAVGTQWSFQSGPLIVRERVVQHEDFRGERCARIDTIFDDELVSYEHIAVRADGVYRVGVSGKPIQPPLKIINLPARPDTKWTVDSSVAGQPIRGEFVSSEGTFSVRSRGGDADTTFKTYRVSGEKMTAGGTTLSLVYDFVPKFGKVKQVARTGGVEATLELKDYQTPPQVPTRSADRGGSLLR